MPDPERGSEREPSENGYGWVPTAGAIVLLVIVVAFGLCCRFLRREMFQVRGSFVHCQTGNIQGATPTALHGFSWACESV